jgi:hypothetical protein
MAARGAAAPRLSRHRSDKEAREGAGGRNRYAKSISRRAVRQRRP